LVLLNTYGSIYYKPLALRNWLARYLRIFIHLSLKDKLNYPIKGVTALQRRLNDACHKLRSPTQNRSVEAPSNEPKLTPFMTADAEETYVEVTPVSTANNEALRHYTPAPYSEEMVLFPAHQQPWWSEHDALIGWAGLAEGGIQVYEISGHHHNMTYEPHGIEMAQQFSDCIKNSLEAI
jgi:hypothetical protein